MNKTVTKMKTLKLYILALLSCLIISSCAKNPTIPAPPVQALDIYTSLSTSAGYSILSASILQLGLKDSLQSGKGPYTLFAPSDLDFANYYGIKTPADLNKISPDSLKSIITYHLFKSSLSLDKIPAGPDTPRNSSNGLPAFFTQVSSNSGLYVYINGIPLVNSYPQKNGIIYLMNGGALNPPTYNTAVFVQKTAKLSLLNAAIIHANLSSTLSGATIYTLFAPTDSAFGVAGYKTVQDINNTDPAVLTKLLNYHIIQGRSFSSDLIDGSFVQTLNGGKIQFGIGSSILLRGASNTTPSTSVLPNRCTSNGVVYLIDQVLKP